MTKNKNRPATYMTKTKKIVKKKEEILNKKKTFDKAVQALNAGKFKSLRKCAVFYKVPKSTLHDLYVGSSDYQGGGRRIKALTSEEEARIVEHVKWRASIGCGVNWRQLQCLVQEVFLGMMIANPDRETGYEETGQLPNIMFVRRLAQRNNLSLRSTSEISKGNIQ